jgi:catalase
VPDDQYHWLPEHTAKQFTFEEAATTGGIDPDYSKRQLFETIDKGGNFKWTMMIQVG